MKSVVIALLGVCLIEIASAAFDVSCNAKIQSFKDCHVKIRAQHESEASARLQARQAEENAIDTCYHASGCTPPVPGQGGNNEKFKDRVECSKDVQNSLKPKIQECVAKKVPGFNLPGEQNRQDGERQGFQGGRKHDQDSIQKACGSNTAAVATVKACIATARKNNGPAGGGKNSQADAEARFNANCKVKQDCEAQLGVKCKDELEKAEEALCECHQQVRNDQNLVSQARAASSACKNLPAPKANAGQGQGQGRSCGANQGKKDWCKEGYQAFVNDKKSHQKQGGGGGDHH